MTKRRGDAFVSEHSTGQLRQAAYIEYSAFKGQDLTFIAFVMLGLRPEHPVRRFNRLE